MKRRDKASECKNPTHHSVGSTRAGFCKITIRLEPDNHISMLLNSLELRLVGYKFKRLRPVDGFDVVDGVSNTPSNPHKCIKPIRNTIQRTILDYLSCFIQIDSESHLKDLVLWLDDYFSTETVYSMNKPFSDGHNTFWHTAESVNGIKYRFSMPGEEGYPTKGLLFLTFSGRPLSELMSEEKIFLMSYLDSSFSPRWNRADVANDMNHDYGLQLISRMRDAIQRNDYKGFRKSRSIKSDDGDTLYCGKRGSDKSTRIYDKKAESNGEIDSFRHELELKHDYSQNFVESSILILKSTGSYKKVVEYWRSLLVGQISFVDKTYDPSGKNISRCPQLWWWVQYIHYVGSAPIKMSVPRKKTSFPEKVAWMLRSWSTSVAQFEQVYGYERLMFLIDELKRIGNEKMTAFHRAEIRIQISQNNDENREFYSFTDSSFLSPSLNEAYRRLSLV